MSYALDAPTVYSTSQPTLGVPVLAVEYRPAPPEAPLPAFPEARHPGIPLGLGFRRRTLADHTQRIAALEVHVATHTQQIAVLAAALARLQRPWWVRVWDRLHAWRAS